MAFYLLRPNPVGSEYKVFMDIKDTRGKEKLKKIEVVFNNHHRGGSPFVHFQHLRSHENVFFQLADLFIGAISFKSRGLHLCNGSQAAKINFIKYLEYKSGYPLDSGTPQWETKFNIFDHHPKAKL